MRDPKVFLFDEPLSNLDAAMRMDMRIETGKLHQNLGASMIYVTHDQVEAMTLGDKIVVPRKAQDFAIGQAATMGIRPQYLHPADAGTGKLHGKVILTERLGSETEMDVTLADGTKIIAALGQDSIQISGTPIHVDFDPAQAHVFPETL